VVHLNLSALVRDTADQFSVDSDVHPGITLTGQSDLIRRAIVNLVENASKYGAPPVHICLSRAGTHAVIEVSDGGSGFDPATAGDMLKPFRRGEHGAQIAGSGLGLTIVDRAAASHKGEVFFQRRGPTGFVATLTLRLKTEA